MKIAFVEPKNVENHIFSNAKLPLLGSVYLSTILKKKGHDVKIFNENFSPAMTNGKLDEEIADSDVVMMTALSDTSKRAYNIARTFKQMYPDKKLIMGGVHATFMPEEAKQVADTVVIGEAEGNIDEILHSNEKFIYGKPVENLDELPYPDFSLIKKVKMKVSGISTSRGCPFNCKFCSVTKMFGRKYRFRSAENVLGELNTLDAKNTFFYDDNFTANKERTVELLKGMIKEKVGGKWEAQVRSEVANDEEILSLMRKSNCKKVYIGFESINEKTLKAYNKCQTVKDIKKAVENFHNNGISVHGMFVLGSDNDTKSTVADTAEFCDKNEVDTAQFLVLTPLPGTNTYKEFDSQKRIFNRDWSFYDGMHVVYKPKLIDPYDLQVEIFDAHKNFYSFSKGIRQSMGDSLNYNILSMKNWFTSKKSELPDLKNGVYKFIGNSIVKKWEKQNAYYMEYLKKISENLKNIKIPEINLTNNPT